MFNNLIGKKILLICKESYSFPFYFLAQELLKNNKVGAFFINPMETFLNRSPMNENTYYKFKNLKNVSLFDLNNVCSLFTANLSTTPINWEYIKKIQNQYTFYKTINLQLSTAQMFTYDSHYRFYYSPSSQNQRIYWLQLNYQKIEQILEKFNPDVILDLDNSEMQRSIIAEVSRYSSIPYISINNSRADNYKIPSYACVWDNDYFKRQYQEILLSNEDLRDEEEYIEEFRKKDKILSIEFKNQITSQFSRSSMIRVFKNIYTKFGYIFSLDIISKNYFIRKNNPILFHSSFKYLKFIIYTELKRWYLFGKNIYFSNPVDGEKYVLMPLHLVPESSTLVLAPFFVDELHCIRQVAKSLPPHLTLYVKEHQVMAGERSFKFYKKVNSIPNVKMIQFNYFDDPKPWINNSEGVITITGTGAYEAALLGKRSIVFGNVPFDIIEGVTKISSFESLPKTLSQFGIEGKDNLKSCAAYLKTIKNVGHSVPLHYLIMESENILMNNYQPNQEFTFCLQSLHIFFEKAYSQYLNCV